LRQYSSSIRILVEDLFYLPIANKPIENLEAPKRLAIFSWLSMLWLAFVNKAISSGKQDERTDVLEAVAAFKSPIAASRLTPLDISRHLEMDRTKSYLLVLYTRIGKLLSLTPTVLGSTIDGNATWQLLLLYEANASVKGKVTFAGLWSQTKREGERLAKHASRTVTEESYRMELKNATSIVGMISQVVQTALDRSDSQLLDEWKSQKEWQALMDYWLGLYRAVGITT
jgi:hypothetical protein